MYLYLPPTSFLGVLLLVLHLGIAPWKVGEIESQSTPCKGSICLALSFHFPPLGICLTIVFWETTEIINLYTMNKLKIFCFLKCSSWDLNITFITWLFFLWASRSTPIDANQDFSHFILVKTWDFISMVSHPLPSDSSWTITLLSTLTDLLAPFSNRLLAEMGAFLAHTCFKSGSVSLNHWPRN